MNGDPVHPGSPEPIDAEFEPTREAAPRRTRPPSRMAAGGGLGAALGLTAVAALSGAVAGTLAPRAPGMAEAADAFLPNELTDLRQSQALLEQARAEDAAKDRADIEAAKASLASIEQRLDEWQRGLMLLPEGPAAFEPLRRRVAALEALPADPSAASPEQLARAVAGVQERMRTLEAATANALAYKEAAEGANPAELARRLDLLAGELTVVNDRLNRAATAAEVQGVAAELRGLQGRLGAIAQEATLAVENSRIAAAVSAASDAAQAPGPFMGAYEALAGALPNDPNVRALASLARTGAPSVAQLKEEFALIELDVTRASRANDAGGGVWGDVQGALAPYLIVRRIDAARDTSSDTVARAASRLEVGDLQSAVMELSKLSGEAKSKVDPWLVRARARLEIEARLAAVRAELTRRGAT